MTISEISRHLSDRLPVPGLTDAQNEKAFELWATSDREAQTYVMGILEPKLKRTLL